MIRVFFRKSALQILICSRVIYFWALFLISLNKNNNEILTYPPVFQPFTNS